MSFAIVPPAAAGVAVLKANWDFAMNGCATVICGWWNARTLTSGDRYWTSTNTLQSLVVDTTTSQLRLRLSYNSISGIYRTTDANIVVNEWYWIAVIISVNNNTATATYQIWLGTPLLRPRKLTTTQVQASSGNYVGQDTSMLLLASTTSGGDDFDGYVSKFEILQTPGYRNGANEAIIDTYVYNKFLEPLWKNNLSRMESLNNITLPGGTDFSEYQNYIILPLDSTCIETTSGFNRKRYPVRQAVRFQVTPVSTNTDENFNTTDSASIDAPFSEVEPPVNRFAGGFNNLQMPLNINFARG